MKRQALKRELANMIAEWAAYWFEDDLYEEIASGEILPRGK
jgi:hypothetical protein